MIWNQQWPSSIIKWHKGGQDQDESKTMIKTYCLGVHRYMLPVWQIGHRASECPQCNKRQENTRKANFKWKCGFCRKNSHQLNEYWHKNKDEKSQTSSTNKETAAFAFYSGNIELLMASNDIKILPYIYA